MGSLYSYTGERDWREQGKLYSHTGEQHWQEQGKLYSHTGEQHWQERGQRLLFFFFFEVQFSIII
jgi:hypothetical protein